MKTKIEIESAINHYTNGWGSNFTYLITTKNRINDLNNIELYEITEPQVTEFIVNIKHKDGVRDFLLFKMFKNSSIEEIKREAINTVKECAVRLCCPNFIPKKTILISECNVKNGIKIKTKWR